ncbi:MAG: type I glutamate--ammonia ligase [Alphaproteobacteria bacterium]
MSKFSNIYRLIKENDVKFINFRFTDTTGQWQHTSQAVEAVDDDFLENGIMFDGSSIAGWRTIDKSDMCLKPDVSTAVMDPFFAQPTLVVICDVYDPETNEPYEKCPRSIGKKALAYLNEANVGDTAYFGPEPEFFLFDDVKFSVGSSKGYYELDSSEDPLNSDKTYEFGNSGHRPAFKGGYFPVPPVDSANDLRAEMLTTMAEMGVSVEKHHHEVAASQHELGIKYNTLTESADDIQKYKYVVHNVSHLYGKTATFLPKPIYGDNGSGMHIHQSIWKDGKALFAGDRYAGLSEMALHYIGGIIKHARALNAFTNPTTNSYKRLIPGFEAPVILAYSANNRSVACRIPHVSNPKGMRVESRFPDPTANPYLAYAALMLAGLDGIKNKIHPGEAMDQDLFELPQGEVDKIPSVCRSLRQALESLDADREFLKAGDVFSDNYIDDYIELKMKEVYKLEHTPHPVEFSMYYSW